MPNSLKPTRGLDVLRDFTDAELGAALKDCQESYDLSHRTMTLMKDAAPGIELAGLHRHLNTIARERRCFYLSLWRRAKRDHQIAIVDHRKIVQRKPDDDGFYLGLQEELGFDGFPKVIFELITGKLWVFERIEGRTSALYLQNCGESLLHILTPEGVKEMNKWLRTSPLIKQERL